jgi:TPR repeat protein
MAPAPLRVVIGIALVSAAFAAPKRAARAALPSESAAEPLPPAP